MTEASRDSDRGTPTGPEGDVLGVLLAAGTSSRFADGSKLVATLDGTPLVVHAARTLHASRVDDVIAVLGHERVREALDGLGLDTVVNPDFADGQATSVARGAAVAAERDAAAACFALGDMPCVDPATIDALLNGYRGSDAGIVVPTHGGRRGNPVLFENTHFDALRSVSGDAGGRELFQDHPVERVPVDDPGIHEDVDTVADLAELRERCEP